MTDDGIVRLVVNSDKTLLDHDKTVFDMYKEHKHLTISIRPGLDRSVQQNRLQSGMYERIARDLDSFDFKLARAHCKWYHGIPIMRRDAEGFSASFDRVFGELDHDTALRLMNPNKLFPSDGFPVTRHFSKKQSTEYIKMIDQEFTEQGVDFSDLLDQ